MNTNTNNNASRLLFVGIPADKAYLPRLKACIGTASCAVILETPTTLYELKKIADAKQATAVISTSSSLLSRLVSLSNNRRKPSIDNYAGSVFKSNGLEILFVNPLEQLITVPYAQFITTRYISKLIAKTSWKQFSPFNWKLFEPSIAESTLERFQSQDTLAIAIDIETFSNPVSIRCVGYTAVFLDGTFESLVIPCDSEYNLQWIRKFNWDTKAPKIFQNGKYDISYLSMYNAVPYNYLWDTATLFHSWYSELPKDLASLNSFCVRDSMYWKDLADTSDLHTYYLYNAKDTYATACVWLSLMQEMPDWARNNYMNEFPLLFPCHMSEMIGIKRDIPSLQVQCKEVELSIASKNISVSKQLGVPSFNVNSPVQMKELLKILGCGDLESADAKNLAKAKFRHPLNARILNQVLDIRKERKLVSTYLTPGKEFKGRILYSLNPHGTDTGRLASKEHHFWCGLQVQNIPRGTTVKKTFIADPGFRFVECDLEQAESRDTGYIAGEETLINNVEHSPDFHSSNASMFFGVPFEQIYDIAKEKVINKALRTLAKPVNHGANYNMGPMVLIDTMGEGKIEEAARLLKLPRLYSHKQIAEHLLAQFHRTYPAISHIYYPGVIHEILTTKKLTSKATHDVPYQASSQGLVRYCFNDPSKSKSALNAYVAHPPQSLNAMTLNKAYMRVFYDVALKYPNAFKLLAQIHDSILFEVRDGRSDIIKLVQDYMQIPVTVVGYDGKERTFKVPAAAKAGADGLGALNWGDTE